MLIYMVYDKATGQIVHTHRVVDIAGRSCHCSEQDILSALPAHINRQSVGIVSTEIDQPPSGRQARFKVDLATGTLIREELSRTS